MKTAIYMRGRNESIEKQIKHLKTFLGTTFYEADIYNEGNASGIDTNRRELNSLLEKLKYYDEVYVYSMPVLSRNIEYFQIITILASLCKTKINFIENDVFKKVREKEHEENKLPRNAPYGYKKENNQISINKEEANIIKMIFELYLEQTIGLYDIYYILVENGVKTRSGKDFLPTTISKILDNEIYIGNYTYNKSEIYYENGKRKRNHKPITEWKIRQGVFPPIIDELTFLKVKVKKETLRSMYGSENR